MPARDGEAGNVTVFRINAGENGLRTSDDRPGLVALRHRLADLSPGTPVTILVHGYRYAPMTEHDPHDLIFSLRPPPGRARVVSWPRHVARGADRFVVAFGWPARGSIWRAAMAGEGAAAALAAVIGVLHRDGRETSILAHSLGAAVALAALHHLPANTVARMVLMFGAVFRSEARDALESPAGLTCDVLNVTSRENLLFDLLHTAALGLSARGAVTVTQGWPAAPPNWLDLPIDCPVTARALSALGFPVARPARRICHWSPYLRPGLFPLYRAFISGDLSSRRMRAVLP